jgi:hypothetical protein
MRPSFVFAAALYHAIGNVCTLLFPAYYDPRITGLLVTTAAATVTLAWGPKDARPMAHGLADDGYRNSSFTTSPPLTIARKFLPSAASSAMSFSGSPSTTRKSARAPNRLRQCRAP